MAKKLSDSWDDSRIPTLTFWNRMKHTNDEWPGDEEYFNFFEFGSRKCAGYL